jgi:WS/DGAT/MGAT family acyltransferase
MEQLPGSDAVFLALETPTTHAHIGAVAVLSPASESFGFERFCKNLEERMKLAPRFTKRLREVPLGLDRPYFVDADFDITNHVRRIAVPSPGSLRDLADLVSALYPAKLDRRLPLWEMWWIEGLEDDRVALFSKTHHALIDGASGIGLAELMCDLKPDPKPRKPEKKTRKKKALAEPTDFELYLRGLWQSFGTPWRVTRYLGQAAWRGAAALPFVREGKLAMAGPKLSFNADISARRAVGWTTVSLSDVRAIKKHFDVKVNDVVLELCGSAVRRYLKAFDEMPEESLVVSVPVSTRSEGDKELGNQVGSMMVSWATDIEDPVERLKQIHQNTTEAKEMGKAMRARDIQAMGDTVSPAVLNLAYRMISATAAMMPASANAVVSNVPGAPVPIYMAGGLVEATYPISIIMPGMGLNVTVVSYLDRVDFGFTVDPELVEDPWFLAEGVPLALEELKAAAGIDHSVPLRADGEGPS